MMAPAAQYSWTKVRTAVVFAVVAVASSCVGSSHSLQQVRTSNPSVTYAYSGDEELLRAEQNAVTFCRQYNAAPGPARITSNPNAGTKTVVFECGPSVPVAVALPAPNPNLTYVYRTDEELLAASRTVGAYCANNGSRAVVSNTTTNADGSKTVVFECSPNLPVAAAPQPALGPNLTYIYRTDEELLAASRTAGAYCANTGSREAVSNITTNADGSKTVTFQCTPA